MYRRGHYGITLLAFAPVADHCLRSGSLTATVLVGVTMLACTPVPDYDRATSLVTHRGITHTLIFALLFGGVLGGIAGGIGSVTTVWGANEGAIVGFATGGSAICSHLVGDVITPAGIRPFAPFWNGRVSLDVVRAEDPVANDGFLILGLLVIGWVGKNAVLVSPG